MKNDLRVLFIPHYFNQENYFKFACVQHFVHGDLYFNNHKPGPFDTLLIKLDHVIVNHNVLLS